jgi:cytochrome c553
MKTRFFKITFMLLIFCGLGVFTYKALVQDAMEQPPPRNIPGITTEDKYPSACVSCHKDYPDMKMDVRISNLMKQMAEKVDAKLLAKSQGAMSGDVQLKGKHPSLNYSTANIPEICIKCHEKSAKNSPPFKQLIHLIHITGGKDNYYMTMFQGECTYCHKLDKKTGIWSVPSGKEQ